MGAEPSGDVDGGGGSGGGTHAEKDNNFRIFREFVGKNVLAINDGDGGRVGYEGRTLYGKQDLFIPAQVCDSVSKAQLVLAGMCLMEEHMGLQQLHDNPDKNKKKKRRVSNPTGDGEHASMSDPKAAGGMLASLKGALGMLGTGGEVTSCRQDVDEEEESDRQYALVDSTVTAHLHAKAASRLASQVGADMQRQQARVKSLENLVEAKNEALASKQDEIEGKDLEIKVRDSQIRQLRASFAQLSTTVAEHAGLFEASTGSPHGVDATGGGGGSGGGSGGASASASGSGGGSGSSNGGGSGGGGRGSSVPAPKPTAEAGQGEN